MKTLTREQIEAIETSNYLEAMIKEAMLEHDLNHIVTRFPPEPNGYLHIGHVKACMINIRVAQKFGGYTNLRFDDTNPNKEDIKYEKAIKDAMDWLGFEFKNVCYASDYYETMFEKAIRLIKKGKAYVCDLTPEEITEYRGTFTRPGKDSPYRDRSIEENLELFNDMRNRDYFPEKGRTLRAKIDMASPNINLRDPVLYRILQENHYRTGDKWQIYPMYDYAHPIEDAIEGITHSLCSLEYEDHRPLYEWVIKECEFDNKPVNPRQIEFARFSLNGAVMSKRHIKSLVDSGKIDGWSDPRLPTIAGMRARGYTPEAIKDFVSRIGVAKSPNTVEPAMLEACVREELNTTATRVMVVTDPVKVRITNLADNTVIDAEIDNNPTVENSGTHKASFSNEIYIERDDFALDPPPKYNRLVEGGMVRLKGAYIIKCEKANVDKDGIVTELLCTYITESKSGSDTSGLKVKGTIHWVDAKTCVDIKINEYAPLIKAGAIFEGSWDGVYNEDSLKIFNGKGEKFLTTLHKEARVQFIRRGYYFLVDKNEKNIEFNQTVSLKDSYKL